MPKTEGEQKREFLPDIKKSQAAIPAGMLAADSRGAPAVLRASVRPQKGAFSVEMKLAAWHGRPEALPGGSHRAEPLLNLRSFPGASVPHVME